ncbi:MAG: hypothetical protein K2H82_11415, partial [Oscillospiraceae bacterium]|nr:hypothetical protein [Oscillospiraceae bacterium]
IKFSLNLILKPLLVKQGLFLRISGESIQKAVFRILTVQRAILQTFSAQYRVGHSPSGSGTKKFC